MEIGALATIVMPFAAYADGAASLVTAQKARLTYGQTVLALQDASPETILANANTIKLYISAIERAKGKKIDGRKVGSKILVAAEKGDKTAANAALVDLVKSTKLSKYVPGDIVSGSKFMDASGLWGGDVPPNMSP